MSTLRIVILTAASISGILHGGLAYGGPISFSEARDRILSANAGLESARTGVDAARAGVSQASVISNPTLSVGLDKFGANEIEASVEQTFELGGKRRLRTEVAQIDMDAAKNSHLSAENELEAEIVRRFIPIAIVSRKLSLIDSAIAISEATKDQIQKRVDAGAARKTDMLRAEIEIDRLKLERSEFERENRQARDKFAALGGEKEPALLNVAGELNSETEVPSLDALRKAIAESPLVASADIEIGRRTIERKLLRAEAAPDVNLSAGYLRSNSENTHSPLVGVSADIPLFNRNAAAREQLDLQQNAAARLRENMLRLLDADVRGAHSRLLEIDKKISVLKTATIPKAGLVYSTMQEYYAAGSAGFLDLAAARSEMLDLRIELLDMETERAHALADLMQTTSLHIQIVK